MKRHIIILCLFLSVNSVYCQGVWQKIAVFNNPVPQVFSPYFINEKLGFVYTEWYTASLNKTVDGGKTWSQVTSFFPPLTDFIDRIQFVSPAVGYVITYFSGTIYKSIDSGGTWNKIRTGGYSNEDIYIKGEGQIFSSFGSYSLDDGKTWVGEYPYYPGANAIAGNKDSAVVAAMKVINPPSLDGGSLYTIDNGASWHIGERQVESWTIYSVPHTPVYFRSSEASGLGYLDPGLDFNIILRSTDGGATWQTVYPTLPPLSLTGGIDGGGCAVYAQTRYPLAPNQYVSSGSIRTFDNGQTWSSIGGPSSVRDTRPSVIEEGAIYFVGDGLGGLWKYTDSSLLRLPTWNMSIGHSSSSLINDTIYSQVCDSTLLFLYYGFSPSSCEHDIKLDDIAVEGIPTSAYRSIFVHGRSIQGLQMDTSRIMFMPTTSGIFPLKIHTSVYRDGMLSNDTSFSLTLVVKATPILQVLKVSDTIDFGKQTLCIAKTINDSFSIKNIGCDFLQVLSIVLEVDQKPKTDFNFKYVPPFTLNSRDSEKSFIVTYKPTAVGKATGRLIITTTVGIDTINLRGEGLQDSRSLSCVTDLLEARICDSAEGYIHITNTSCHLMELDTVALTPPLQLFPGQFPRRIGSGVSTLIHIRFIPKTVGSLNIPFTAYTRIFNSSDTEIFDTSFIVSIQGLRGMPVFNLSQLALDFGTMSECFDSTETIHIYSTGCDTLFLLSASIDGDMDFSLNSINGKSLPPGDSIAYRITLKPSSTGVKKSLIRLHFNSGEDTTIKITSIVTKGTVILEASTNAIDFGTTTLCEQRDSVIHLSNIGCDTLVISGVGFRGSGFGTNFSFPITLLPGKDTSIDIFTLLDTAGGKSSNSATITFTSNSDNTISPITLTRSYIPSKNINIEYYLDPQMKSGGDTSIVNFDIKETPGKTFLGTGIKQIAFDLLNYNTDLLQYTASKSTANLSSADGKSFTLTGSPEITADANGILASVGFRIYLTKDSITTINMTNRADTTILPCSIMTLTSTGTAIFNYQFLCGERSISGFMNGIPIKITSIHPNPAQDEIEINLQSAVKQNTSIEIFDALGAKKFSDRKNISNGANTFYIDTKALPSGMYLVKVGEVSRPLVISR